MYRRGGAYKIPAAGASKYTPPPPLPPKNSFLATNGGRGGGGYIIFPWKNTTADTLKPLSLKGNQAANRYRNSKKTTAVVKHYGIERRSVFTTEGSLLALPPLHFLLQYRVDAQALLSLSWALATLSSRSSCTGGIQEQPHAASLTVRKHMDAMRPATLTTRLSGLTFWAAGWLPLSGVFPSSRKGLEWTKAPGSESAARICPRKSPPKRGLWESYFLQGIIGKTHTRNLQNYEGRRSGGHLLGRPLLFTSEFKRLLQKSEGNFSEQSPASGFCGGFFGGFFRALFLGQKIGINPPKNPRRNSIGIWELRGQNPHSKDPALTNGGHLKLWKREAATGTESRSDFSDSKETKKRLSSLSTILTPKVQTDQKDLLRPKSHLIWVTLGVKKVSFWSLWGSKL